MMRIMDSEYPLDLRPVAQRMGQRFSVEVVAREISQVYERVLGRHYEQVHTA